MAGKYRQRTTVLLVAMADSVHTARWLEQFAGRPVDFILFPSTPNRRVHPDIERLVRAPESVGGLSVKLAPGSRTLSLILGVLDLLTEHRLKGVWLKYVIKQCDSDFIHALEFQHAGYILLHACRRQKPGPTIIVTNWGSDIYWFKRFPRHLVRIKRLLQLADAYSSECYRDLRIARELGFAGYELPVIPNAGGLPSYELSLRAREQPPSTRNIVLVKGYDRFVGLAQIALDAVELCADSLGAYTIIVYSASERVQRRVDKIRNRHGLAICSTAPYEYSHGEMLELFLSARVYLGMSRSDGISTSLLEALACGAFPIQTTTSCADEWMIDGVSGSLLNSFDATEAAAALREAVENDTLVDTAAEINYSTIRDRADRGRIAALAAQYYMPDL